RAILRRSPSLFSGNANARLETVRVRRLLAKRKARRPRRSPIVSACDKFFLDSQRWTFRSAKAPARPSSSLRDNLITRREETLRLRSGQGGRRGASLEIQFLAARERGIGR